MAPSAQSTNWAAFPVRTNPYKKNREQTHIRTPRMINPVGRPKSNDVIPNIGIIDKGITAPVMLRSGLSLRTRDMANLRKYMFLLLYTLNIIKYIIFLAF